MQHPEGWGIRVAVPNGTEAGRVIVLVVRDDVGTSLTITPPAGFTLIHRLAGTDGSLSLWSKTLAAPETAQFYLVGVPNGNTATLAVALVSVFNAPNAPSVAGSGTSSSGQFTTGSYSGYNMAETALMVAMGGRGVGGSYDGKTGTSSSPNFPVGRLAGSTNTKTNVNVAAAASFEFIPPPPIGTVPTTFSPITFDLRTENWSTGSSMLTQRTEWIALTFVGSGVTAAPSLRV